MPSSTKLCSTPGCPEITEPGASRCPDHAGRYERQRGTRQHRGYGREHEQTRADLLPRAYGCICPVCGQIMKRGQSLELDHSRPRAVDRHSRGDRIIHRSCNRRGGAQLHNARPSY